MKKIAVFIFFSLFGFNLFADSLEAKPVADLLSVVQKQKFKYVETGLVFGFVSIQSCLFASEDMIVLKNYCFPPKEYPASGYTIISEKFGIIDFYSEKLYSTVKRDIQITAFGNVIKDRFRGPYSKIRIAKLNNVLEEIYNLFGPACWSTNFSYSEGEPEYDCTVNREEVLHLENWGQETQSIAGKEENWSAVIEEIEKNLPSTE